MWWSNDMLFVAVRTSSVFPHDEPACKEVIGDGQEGILLGHRDKRRVGELAVVGARSRSLGHIHGTCPWAMKPPGLTVTPDRRFTCRPLPRPCPA
jgi:hypothetical protein